MDLQPHEALDRHRGHISRLLGEPQPREVTLDRLALGRVLAADLVAADDLPRFDNSAMDGFALHPRDEQQREFVVVGDVPAGLAPAFELGPGEAARVMTGARLPEGTVTVVPVEATDATPTGAAPSQVTITGLVPPGRHVRAHGEEVSAGTTMALLGATITPALIALARSAGCAQAQVYSRLRVAVVATGAELVDTNSEPGPGAIHESNSDMIAALSVAAGCTARHVSTCDDEPSALRTRLDGLAESGEVDLVITTGGVSAGAYEVVRQLCEPLAGFRFARLPMQPGGPQGLGRWREMPVVCLPGTPAGAFVAFYALVRPAIDAHHGVVRPPRESAVYVGAPRSMREGKVQYLSGIRGEGGTVHLPRSRHLMALAEADALIELPAEVSLLREPDVVRIHPL